MVRPVETPIVLNEFIGHDGKHYLDLAVDSGGVITVAWLRRRREDKKYFLVVSVVGGHVLKKEVSLVEAQELYHAFPNRLPPNKAFPAQKKRSDRGKPVLANNKEEEEPKPDQDQEYES
jgi:hypothetical protein